MAFSPMDGVSEARRKRFGCEIPRVLSLRKGGNVNSHPEDMMVVCREDAENPGTYVGVIAFGDDGEVKFYPDGRCVACSPDEFYIQDREVYEAFRSRVHGKNGDSDRKKDLEKRDLEEVVREKAVSPEVEKLPENVENREYVLERTEYPDIMSEELMYDVLEGTFLDDNFEVLELSPMRWQDWYNERIDKIQETVKALSEYIEKHKY